MSIATSVAIPTLIPPAPSRESTPRASRSKIPASMSTSAPAFASASRWKARPSV